MFTLHLTWDKYYTAVTSSNTDSLVSGTTLEGERGGGGSPKFLGLT